LLDLLSPLFDLLVCLFKWGAGLLLAGIVGLVNLLIAGLMAILGPLLALLPTVDLAQVDLPPFLAWANYVFPLDQFVIATGLVVSVLVSWQLIQLALRWLKAVP